MHLSKKFEASWFTMKDISSSHTFCANLHDYGVGVKINQMLKFVELILHTHEYVTIVYTSIIVESLLLIIAI